MKEENANILEKITGIKTIVTENVDNAYLIGTEPCELCTGDGRFTISSKDKDRTLICPKCNGKGRVIRESCEVKE